MSLRLSEAEVRFYSDVLFALKGIRGETDDPDIEFHVEQVTFGIDGESLGDAVTIQPSDLAGEYDLVIQETKDYLDEFIDERRTEHGDERSSAPKPHTYTFKFAPVGTDLNDADEWEDITHVVQNGLDIDDDVPYHEYYEGYPYTRY